MCEPVTIALIVAGVGAAVAGGVEYKKTREANKNMKRQQEAKNNAFREEMERQRAFSGEGQDAFGQNIENQGKDNFQQRLDESVDSRLSAFGDAQLPAPTDYQFGNTPKNVKLAQSKAFGEVDDTTLRDASNLADLTSYQDALFNTNLDRNEYARGFGNLADKAGRSSNLMQLDMQSASNNAYKPLNPAWAIAGGAGKAAAMGGAAFAASDASLKQNIEKVDESPSGINIYEFEYKKNPGVKHRGVLAQEILESHPDAVRADADGVLLVNYDAIDVNFQRVN